MIPAERFLVQSEYRKEWLAARSSRVTATEVAEAATPAGFKAAIAKRVSASTEPGNAFMDFGRHHEAWIAWWVKIRTGIMPNTWLIQGERYCDAATPDGLSLDHQEIAEIKTGGKELSSIPRKHRDQMMWQMHCTGAKQCLYTFMLRTPTFQPAWVEPKTQWVERDDNRIEELIEVANDLIATLSGLLGGNDDE